MTWLWWVFGINWGTPLVLSWAYLLWLWLLSKDITFEGWVIYRHVVPIARFRLISTKSWYARMWESWYGFALMLGMIHRDKKGSLDDAHVELTIVHEVYHVVRQILPFGLCFWLAYLVVVLMLKMQGKEPHTNHPFENAARRYASKWDKAGRQRTFRFGVRQ